MDRQVPNFMIFTVWMFLILGVRAKFNDFLTFIVFAILVSTIAGLLPLGERLG